jgi:hypothetical protein
MNSQEREKEDPLKQYIHAERIERAPEGFTSNVMTRIRLETESAEVRGRVQSRSIIPAISAVVTVLLILAAVLIPGNQADYIAKPLFDQLKNIKFSYPEINIASLFSISFPALLIYIFIGIFILSIFDRALYGLFHREK